MKHSHRIIPGHMGGEYVEGNVIDVEVARCDKNTASHAMWHYANWKLWGKEEDKMAWQGLAGMLGKEEIIQELMDVGRARARQTIRDRTEQGNWGWQDPVSRAKAIENSQKTMAEMVARGEHPWQDKEMRARRAAEDRVKRIEEFKNGTAELQKPEVVKKRIESSSKSRSKQNSTPVTCPHCGKTGGYTNMKRYHHDNCKSLRDPS